MLIGARVSSLDEVPDGMVARHVPSQEVTVFTTEQGDFGVVVFNTWLDIWSQEDQKKLNRAYENDYELYDERSLNPNKAQVEIHIGIKK
jgi:predicted transcriptional regulator YdeE